MVHNKLIDPEELTKFFKEYPILQDRKELADYASEYRIASDELTATMQNTSYKIVNAEGLANYAAEQLRLFVKLLLKLNTRWSTKCAGEKFILQYIDTDDIEQMKQLADEFFDCLYATE